MFDIVVVGADGSPTARRAVEAATEIARFSGGVLHIVSAFKPTTYAEGSVPQEFRSLGDDTGVDALLQSLAFIATNRGVTVETHAASGAPADVIVQFADDLGADLVVVGNKGLRGVRRVLGSVPSSVVPNVNCSVAVIATTE